VSTMTSTRPRYGVTAAVWLLAAVAAVTSLSLVGIGVAVLLAPATASVLADRSAPDLRRAGAGVATWLMLRLPFSVVLDRLSGSGVLVNAGSVAAATAAVALVARSRRTAVPVLAVLTVCVLALALAFAGGEHVRPVPA